MFWKVTHCANEFDGGKIRARKITHAKTAGWPDFVSLETEESTVVPSKSKTGTVVGLSKHRYLRLFFMTGKFMFDYYST